MNRRALIAAVRYQLQRLRARNGHHEFEHLCRQLARCTISPRVMPATGPVGSGGDQGRDFETFRTYRDIEAGPLGTFFGPLGDDTRRIVFCCTLQSSNVSTKIRRDVDAIMEATSTPETVYAFCESDVSISQRHKLQRWAGEQHGIELEVLDGEAIAEQLVHPTTFWIASEYLDIPDSAFPSPTSEYPDYSRAYEKWSDRRQQIVSYNDLLQVRSALRTSIGTNELTADYPFWARVIQSMVLSTGTPLLFRRQGVYELCCSSARVRGHLRSHEQLLRWYFLSLRSNADGNALRAACTLLTYCYAMTMMGGLDIGRGRLDGWREWLASETEKRLQEEYRPSERCLLLVQLGRISAIPRPGVDWSDTAMAAVEYWTKMADEMDDVFAFSTREFAAHLAALPSEFNDVPGFRDLLSRLDDVVAKRAGDTTLGALKLQRAAALRQDERLLAALQELHASKAHYFFGGGEDRLVGVLLQISHLYEDLSLHLAAKHYALAAADFARGSETGLAANFLVHAVRCVGDADYQMGMWTEALDAFDLGLRVSAVIQGHPVQGGDSELEAMIVRVCFPLTVASRTKFSFLPELCAKLESNPHWESVSHNLPQAAYFLDSLSSGQEDEQLVVTPFADAGPERTYEWNALGVKWHLVCENDRDISSACEALGSAMQIVLAELAPHDPCLVPTSLHCRIKEGERTELASMNFGQDSCNIEACVARTDLDTLDARPLFNLAVRLCLALCVRPDVESWLQSLDLGSSYSKIVVGGPYVCLLDALYSSIERTPLDSTKRCPTFSTRTPPEPDELSLKQGLAPWLDEDAVVSAMHHRFKHGIETLPRTLCSIRASESASAAVRDMRLTGAKDWQILSALVNLAANYRFVQESQRPPGLEDVDRIRELVELGDAAADSDIPAELLNEDALRRNEKAFVGAFVSGTGAVLPDGLKDIQCIRRLAVARLGYDRDIDPQPDFLVSAHPTTNR